MGSRLTTCERDDARRLEWSGSPGGPICIPRQIRLVLSSRLRDADCRWIHPESPRYRRPTQMWRFGSAAGHNCSLDVVAMLVPAELTILRDRVPHFLQHIEQRAGVP